MTEVEILVDGEVFNDLEALSSTSGLLIIVPLSWAAIAVENPTSIDFTLFDFWLFSFAYFVLLLFSLLFFRSFFGKARSRGNRYSSLLRFGLALLLIFVVMNFVAIFSWFSLPRGPGIIYASSYTRNLLIFLYSSIAILYSWSLFLATVVEFDVMLRELPRKSSLWPLPTIVVDVVHKDDYYIVSVDKYGLLSHGLFFTIGPFCYYLWEVIVFAYVDVFAILGVFLIFFALIALSLLGDPLVKSVMGTKMVVRRREEEVDYETWV